MVPRWFYDDYYRVSNYIPPRTRQFQPHHHCLTQPLFQDRLSDRIPPSCFERDSRAAASWIACCARGTNSVSAAASPRPGPARTATGSSALAILSGEGATGGSCSKSSAGPSKT